MSEHTGTTNNTDGAAQAQPTFPPSVAELTFLLQEVNKLFPPITEELADGRTRKGRQQRQQIAQRDAYIGALQAALSHAATVGRLQREIEMIFEGNQREYALQQRQITNLQRYVDQGGAFVLVAFQLGLLIQQRPQLAVTRNTQGDGHVVDFNLDRLRVNVFGDDQTVQVTAPGMKPQSFTFDSNGNFPDRDVQRLVGFLTMVGYTVDPQHVKLMLSSAARGKIYDSLSSRASALGHIALMGAMLTDGFDNDRSDYVSLMRQKPRASDILFGDKSYDMPYGGDLLG